MKKIFVIPVIPLLLQFSTLQGTEAAAMQEKVNTSPEDSVLMTRVVVGNDLLTIEESDSRLKVRVFNDGISILETLEGRKKVEIERYDNGSEVTETPADFDKERLSAEDETEDNQPVYEEDARSGESYEEDPGDRGYHTYRDYLYEREDRERDNYRNSRNFRGHLSGVNLGFNGYLFDGSTEMPEELAYMETNTGKSIGGSLFFTQADIGLTSHIGFVTGAGITWNNYFFKWHNSIDEGIDGTIVETIPGEGEPVKRSKFATLYLEVPLLLEIQIPAGYTKRLNVAAGVTGGIRLNAWTKTVFKDGEKTRSNGDYNLNLLRGGATARVGFENFMLYGTYYLTPWFHDLKGPSGMNPVPFEIGLAFTIND